MQVRVCPNCSTDNQPEAASCVKCNWSLESVQATEKAAAPPPSPVRQMPASTPARQGSSAGVIILILIVVAGAAFAGWWFLLRGGGGPEATVNNFISAAKAGDIEGLKSTLSKGTASLMAMAPGGEKGAAEDIKKEMATANPRITKTTYEGENAIVAVDNFGVKSSSTGPTELVLTKEEGEWKIDLMATSMREMQKMQRKLGNMGRPRP